MAVCPRKAHCGRYLGPIGPWVGPREAETCGRTFSGSPRGRMLDQARRRPHPTRCPNYRLPLDPEDEPEPSPLKPDALGEPCMRPSCFISWPGAWLDAPGLVVPVVSFLSNPAAFGEPCIRPSPFAELSAAPAAVPPSASTPAATTKAIFRIAIS